MPAILGGYKILIYFTNQEEKMDGACGTCVGVERCIQFFGGEGGT